MGNKKIISDLEDFKNKISTYFEHRYAQYRSISEKELNTIREEIIKKSIKVKQYLKDANIHTRVAFRAPAVVGGYVYQMDLIDDMFQNEGGPFAIPSNLILNTITKAIAVFESGELPSNEEISGDFYVDPTRIRELQGIKNIGYDLTKLLQLLMEINSSYQNGNFFAVGLLIRALIDHVPPIFKQKSFIEVSNNYAGSKSFKESMEHLEKSSRKIADQHLHCQIRNKEILPNKTQINFSNDLDILLAEIVRILK